MRKINQAEIEVVSGAGLSESTGGINNALSQASGLLNAPVIANGEMFVATHPFGQTFKNLKLTQNEEFSLECLPYLTRFA